MVLVHSAAQEQGLYYIIMEFVEGRSLDEHIARHGRLDPREAIAVTIHIAQALQYAWNKAKIIHRDIKPANVFLSTAGEVKVGDLGLAKSVGQTGGDLTQTGTAMGSPHYISPEQARGVREVDFRADIYSLGCTLYHMLTGQPPYDGADSMAIMMKHVTDPPPAIFKALPGCPPPLGMLVGKMLAKNPAERHQSYEQLIADLYAVTEKMEAAAAGHAVGRGSAEPAAAPALKPVKPRIENRGLKIAIAAAAAAVVLIGGLLLWSPWKGRTDEQGRHEDAKTETSSASAQLSKTPILQHSAASAADSALQHSAALQLLGSVYTNAVGAEMVYIPPGEFMLGSTKEEREWALKDRGNMAMIELEGAAPRRAVIERGFWMGRTEVTVGQWKQFVKETGYATDGEKRGESFVPAPGKSVLKKGVSWRNPDFGFEIQDDSPVSCISWNDAMAFCVWLTERERKAGRLVARMVMRLPTEAEWEYACRGGMQTKFWWGDSVEDSRMRLNGKGKDDGFEFLAPADNFGEQGRNRFGFADMLGNVWEWCLDECDATQAHEGLWTGNSGTRVLRGGSFNEVPANHRCASRSSSSPAGSSNSSGFRVVMDVDVSSTRSSTPPSSPASAPKDGGILAPSETRVTTLTTNPKVGEVCALDLGSNVTLDLMGIPPGEFLLGSTPEERAWANANGCETKYTAYESERQQKVTVNGGFWLGRTEVSVGQWRLFVAATGYRTDADRRGESLAPQQPGKPWGSVKGANWTDPKFGFEVKNNDPVSCISWNDAARFCEWLNEREQKAGRLPSGYKVRLPTESEWEYACRAGKQTKFWWGDREDDGNNRLNWSGTADGFEFVSPVDHYSKRGQNRFGLADMLGNVWEWCLDGFDEKQAHEKPYEGNPGARVLRGGSFYFHPGYARCAARNYHHTSLSSSHYGFRVAVGPAR
jgi:formylglycine-generating enzyme required for sulfatase activity